MAKVSILLPTYNGELYIKSSIESVINQTYEDWELIIINDCSKDNTLNIIKEYAAKDSRIKIISNSTNLKLPASLNVGFSQAKGEYLTWTSDDNLYKPNAIEYMVNYLDNNPTVNLITCLTDIIDENDKIVCTLSDWCPKRTINDLLYQNNIGACFMYRSDAAKLVGEYDTSLFLAEDYDYWMRLACTGEVHYSDENLYLYRTHSKSLSVTKTEQVRKIATKVLLKNIPNLALKLGYTNKEIKKLIFKTKYINTLKDIRNIYNKVFAIYREGERKVIKIFGIKVKFKKKPKKGV